MMRLGLMLLLCAVAAPRALAQAPVLFDWFEYRGNDAVFDAPLPPGPRNRQQSPRRLSTAHVEVIPRAERNGPPVVTGADARSSARRQ